jgi:hypothetical protein
MLIFHWENKCEQLVFIGENSKKVKNFLVIQIINHIYLKW